MVMKALCAALTSQQQIPPISWEVLGKIQITIWQPPSTHCTLRWIGRQPMSHTLSLNANLSQISSLQFLYLHCIFCGWPATDFPLTLDFFIHRELSTCQRFPFNPEGWEELNRMVGENKLLRSIPYCAESNTEIQMRANSVAKECQHSAAWNVSTQKQGEAWPPWHPYSKG